MLIILTIATFVLVILRYACVIISWFLSLVTKLKIRVGGIGFLQISDVDIRISKNLSIHIEIISLARDKNHPSRFCVLRFNDVRLEIVQKCGFLRKSDSNRSQLSIYDKTNIIRRLKIIAQYCSLAVNGAHLVVLDILPNCLLHITIDELNLETFRSRHGWQFESSCSLIQGKILQRCSKNGSVLAELSLPFQLSLDVEQSLVNRVALRVSSPSLSFTNDFLLVVESINNDRKFSASQNIQNTPETIQSSVFSDLLDINSLNEVSADVSCMSIKFTNFNSTESRYLSMNFKNVNVMRRNSILQATISELSIADQLLRSDVRISSVIYELSISEEAILNSVLVDGLIARFEFDDAWWWINCTSDLHSRFTVYLKTVKNFDPEHNITIETKLIELCNFSCEFVDLQKQKSKLTIGYACCKRTVDECDFEFELVYFGVDSKTPVLEEHLWGESFFVGAVIAHLKMTDDSVTMTMGIDDLKLEWCERLAGQVKSTIRWIKSRKKNNSSTNDKKLKIKISANRIISIIDFAGKNYVAYYCSKLDVSVERNQWFIETEKLKAAIGIHNSTVAVIFANVFESGHLTPQAAKERHCSPTRRWRREKDRETNSQCSFTEQPVNSKIFFEVDSLHISIEDESNVVDRISILTSRKVFLSWSPQLHLISLNAYRSLKSSFVIPGTTSSRKVPRKIHYCIFAEDLVKVELELARNNCIRWHGEKVEFEKLDNQMHLKALFLDVIMNEQKILSVTCPFISVRLHDDQMTHSRSSFGTLRSPRNKVWAWTADKFRFRLPFDFNFAQVFDEFVNIIKWTKVVHGTEPISPTENVVLPSDVLIEFNEVCLELEDDEFESKLKLSAQLKEDEVYESERREQLLDERLSNLKKIAPFLSKEMIEWMKTSLEQKKSEIYIERWKMSEVSDNPLFVSNWKGWSMRAFADLSLHGPEKCIQLMKMLDPLSSIPDQSYTTLWARAVEFDVEEWTVTFKDYPMKYLEIKDLHFFGTLVAAESLADDGRSIRECTIPLAPPFPTYSVKRNMSPLKFYYDLQCASTEYNCTYGPCWEPCLSMISLVWNNISAPSRDPSQPLPFWDKMRFLLHGKLLWSSEKIVTTMLASNDPYNETETLEMCWEDFGLDWALGEIRIKSGLRVFLRTASRYDDSQILSLPDVRLKVLLGWECVGDPHDHHSVQLCSPCKLPHYSSTEEHDSYRQFRSSCVNVTLNFDVSAGSCTSVDKMPNLLLYSNSFRWIEQFLKSLTTKNRNVRRGRVFGNRVLLKSQLSKHFGKLQVSFSLPKVLLTYWMSHASSYGFRVFSDGLQLTASFRQTVQHSTLNREMNVRRRKLYSWRTHHMTCTWWATQVHVYGGESRPPTDGSPSEDTFLLGFGRVQYARETYPGKDVPLHKVTAYDLKMAWTAENRDACLTIADGVHRAHMLRRILGNDAIKTLNIHLEEAFDHNPKEKTPKKEEKTHRRGYSVSETNPWMLSQLVDEVGTKLVAHCEQSSDIPIDSLLGVQQSTMDDVKLLNWQIDLYNSQLVLKGCERDGFLLVCAAKSQLLQMFHRNVWKQSLLLSKKSWSAKLSGMQYFAPISATGTNKEKFRWLPREVIDDKDMSGFADDFVQKFTATGEAVGGIVQPEFDSGEKIQLQRIVSRCSCQIYFCYFSDELKTDSSEDISVPPQMSQKRQMFNADTVGIDVLTLKHNMLEAMSNSEQYEMVVDIVNNLALFVDPNKKEMGEKRRRQRFECQIMSMSELREKIMRYQSDLREIVSLGRYLERQLFYLNQGEHEQVEHTEEQLTLEAEENKQRMLTVSERLATYISSYKQLQINKIKNYDSRDEKKDIEVVRRFEVCFEDCTWKLTESDGQIALAQTQIRNFLYTRTVRDSNCGDHLFEVGSVRIANLLPDSIYKHALHRDETRHSRQPAIRLFVRDMPPVGGISVKEHFELNIAPMVAEITHKLFDKMMRFFFPGRNIHTNDALDTEVDTSTFSFTRKIASSLSIKNNKSSTEKVISQQKVHEKDDIDRMKERADKVNHFMYIKIPEVSFVVSYKGNKETNLIDVNQFNFIFPLCEYHEQNWTWLDLALAVKQRCKRVLLQQFMRQKLLRNRISNFSIDPVAQGISEDEKKRIAVGIATTDQKCSRKNTDKKF